MISDFVVDLCTAQDTVTSRLAREPDAAPGKVAKELFGSNALPKTNDCQPQAGYDHERALRCGRWGSSKPSVLFLKMYEDVLATLDKNHPLAGMCSPPLMGSTGVCPLTMVATVPEICRHMSNLIVKAKQEIFLATNYWKYSEGSRLICNALRELSKRALGESRRVVVKIMYDRGDAKQLITPHQKVPPSTFADPNGPVRIPHPDDLPNVDIEVVNYHRPPLGTFHAKFAIIDRQIGILQSNNIQDNDNLEMMSQFEGSIVDSLYDMALFTWHNSLSPRLPCLTRSAADSPLPTYTSKDYEVMYDEKNELRPQFTFATAITRTSNSLGEIAERAVTRTDLPLHTSQDAHYDDEYSGEILRSIAGFVPRNNEPLINGVSAMLNVPAEGAEPTVPDIQPSEMMTPLIPLPRHDPFPIAMVCREPYGPPTKASLHTPQNAAFISGFRNAEKSVFIQTPNLNAADLLPEIVAACKRGVHVTYYYCLGYNDAGELLPMQGGHNESVANKLYNELSPDHHKNLSVFCYVGKDQNQPIHNKFKRRSCHIKLLVVDRRLGILGSGNQDSQSWYHSQEVNVMIDSALVCGKWMEAIRQNENTHKFGQVCKDGPAAGCWIDPDTGKQAEGAIGVSAGKFSWAYGVQGAIARVRGTGGF